MSHEHKSTPSRTRMTDCHCTCHRPCWCSCEKEPSRAFTPNNVRPKPAAAPVPENAKPPQQILACARDMYGVFRIALGTTEEKARKNLDMLLKDILRPYEVVIVSSNGPPSFPDAHWKKLCLDLVWAVRHVVDKDPEAKRAYDALVGALEQERETLLYREESSEKGSQRYKQKVFADLVSLYQEGLETGRDTEFVSELLEVAWDQIRPFEYPKCPKCGGESSKNIYYSFPPQTDCIDCEDRYEVEPLCLQRISDEEAASIRPAYTDHTDKDPELSYFERKVLRGLGVDEKFLQEGFEYATSSLSLPFSEGPLTREKLKAIEKVMQVNRDLVDLAEKRGVSWGDLKEVFRLAQLGLLVAAVENVRAAVENVQAEREGSEWKTYNAPGVCGFCGSFTCSGTCVK